MALTTQKAAIARTQANAAGLVHINFVNEVVPWIGKLTGMGQICNNPMPPRYQLVGSRMQFAAEYTYPQPAQSTDGSLPNNVDIWPVELYTTPTRTYQRIAVDNFAEQFAVQPGAYEDFIGRKTTQLMDSFEMWEQRNVHGSSNGTICLANAGRSGGGNDTLVVKDCYGYTGAIRPAQHLEPGMRIAVLDTSAADAVLGAYTISSITYDTSDTTSTIVFTTAISATIAAGDKLVLCTSTTTTDDNFSATSSTTPEPLGALDIIDPAASNSSYLGAAEATYLRLKPQRKTSSDFGPQEIIRLLRQIAAKARTEVNPTTHVLSAQGAVEDELAAQLLPFQQMAQLGQVLDGGYQTVRIAGYDFVFDPFHIQSVLYAWCLEDVGWIDLDGDAAVVALDGSAWSRIPDYDGREMYAKKYGQRIANRRNRHGCLTGLSPNNAGSYSAAPA